MTVGELILRLLLPADDAESILGDLEEDFSSTASKHGLRVARSRYALDATGVILHTRAPEIVAVIGGFASGVAMIAIDAASTNGPLAVVPSTANMILAGVVARLAAVRPYRRRFAIVLTAYAVPFTMLFLAIRRPTIPLAWGLLVLTSVLALGLFFSAPLAYFTRRGTFFALPIALIPIIGETAMVILRPHHLQAAAHSVLRVLFPIASSFGGPRSGAWLSLADVLLWSAIALAVTKGRQLAGFGGASRDRGGAGSGGPS